MGSILSRIQDDEDEYYYLCMKYNQKEQKVYSIHHDWLLDKLHRKTDLSFEEYSTLDAKSKAINRISEIQDKIKKLKAEELELKLKFNL
jgi:hypothetical protein